jgi:two-component system cell cycle response regulator
VKILIAEDDRTSRRMLVAMAARWGYDPVVTENGADAWSVLQEPDAPRLALLDWNMPVLDGLEVCRRLRALPTTDPPYVIILTSRGTTGDVVNGLEAGANDFVAKPYDNEELQARLRVGRRMLDLQAHLAAARDALAQQALHDALTGLFNRRAILERLREEISRARRDGTVLTVGMCDLDQFKAVNDTYGHQTGDDVLRGFAAIAQSQLREYDAIGRYGGEEFLVITPGGTGRPEASLYQRLCARVSGTALPTRTRPVAVTVSIGVAVATSASTVDTLLAAADQALYRAKAEGRNRVSAAWVEAAAGEDRSGTRPAHADLPQE